MHNPPHTDSAVSKTTYPQTVTPSLTSPLVRGVVMSDLPPDQLGNVAEAFAGDDVVRQFTEEKQQLLEDSKALTLDLTLPGGCTYYIIQLCVHMKL